jgi:hypothetical protein
MQTLMQKLTALMLCSLLGSGCSVLLRGSDYLEDGGPRSDAGRDGGSDDAATDGGSDDGGTDGGQENRRPIASGIGLSNYRPIQGEQLRAIPGAIHEPDGDTVRTSIVWMHNGAVLIDETSATLTVDPTRFAVGDAITVELHTQDPSDLEGEVITAGPAIVEADDTTRWRPLLPMRERAEDGVRFFDAARERLLYLVMTRDGSPPTLWEQQLSPSQPGRWVKLPTDEFPEAEGGTLLYDRERDRFFYFGGSIRDGGGADMMSGALLELDMSERGNDVFRELLVAGSAPGPRSFPSYAVAADGTRAWLYGGFADGGTLHRDVWELDFATVSFTRITADAGVEALGGTLIHDAARDRLILVGGGPVQVVGPDAFPTPGTDIHVLDLSASAPTFEMVGSLSGPVVGAGAFVDGDTASLVGGVTSFSPLTLLSTVLEIDLTTASATERSATDAPQVFATTLGDRRPFSSDLIVSGRHAGGGSADFWALDPTTRTFTLRTGAGLDYPPAIGFAIATGRDGTVTIAGGTDQEGGDPHDTVWRYRDGAWTINPILPSEVGNESPTPRSGIVWDGSHPNDNGQLRIVLGGGSGPMDLWHDRDGHWRRYPFSGNMPGSGAPAERNGHVVFRGECGDATRRNELGIFGGFVGGAGWTDTTAMLRCSSSYPPTECQWEDPVSNTSPLPTIRSYASASNAGFGPDGNRGRLVFLFGGRALSSQAFDDLWVFDACSNGTFRGTWMPVMRSDPWPPARTGHSSTHVPAPAGSPDSVPSTILVFAGRNDGSFHNDVWRIIPVGDAFPNYDARFEQLAIPAAGAPPSRAYHVAVWDNVERRLLVYGGMDRDGQPLDDLWELRVR